MDYESTIFQPCKEWIAAELNAGKQWDDIVSLGVPADQREEKLAEMIDELLWPEDLTVTEWDAFIEAYKATQYHRCLAKSEPVIAIR